MEKSMKIRPDVVMASGFLSICMMMVLCVVYYKITGPEGAGFMSAPVAMFLMGYGVLIIAFESVTKEMVKSHLHRQQMKIAVSNVKRLMLISFAAGLVLALLCAAFSRVFALMVFHSSRSLFVLITIAPILLFMSVQGVLRGYLCGSGFSAVSVFSNLILVVITFILSIVFSGIGYKYGLKVNALMHVDDIASAYGAIGAALGITVSCFVSFLFIVIMVLVHRGRLHVLAENSAPIKDAGQQRFLGELIPLWVVFAQGGLLLFVDECVYLMVANSVHTSENNISNWGIYIGQVIAITVFIIFICTVPFTKSWFSIFISIMKREYKVARAKIQNLVHFEAMLVFPVTIWFMVLAGTFTALLFGKTNSSAVNIIAITAPLAIPGVFLVFQIFLLVQLKNRLLILFNAVIGIAAHMATLIIMSAAFSFGIHASIAAFAAMIIFETVLGFIEIRMMLDYKQEFVRPILKPLLAAGVSGLLALAIDKLLVNLIGEALTLIIALVLSYLLYMVMLIVIKSVNRYELERMPFGDQFALIYDRFENR
jgi:hypothetical protein